MNADCVIVDANIYLCDDDRLKTALRAQRFDRFFEP
jgi:hypothetical protein